MINPEDPQLISLNTERRVTPSDIATNQPFKSNYHLDNSTLVFKHPADTEGGGKKSGPKVYLCMRWCVSVHVCVCFETLGSSLKRRMYEQNHRQKGAQWWPPFGTSVVSLRKRNINLLICLQCFLCMFVDIRKLIVNSTEASVSASHAHEQAACT